jgi:hypothetical protein
MRHGLSTVGIVALLLGCASLSRAEELQASAAKHKHKHKAPASAPADATPAETSPAPATTDAAPAATAPAATTATTTSTPSTPATAAAAAPAKAGGDDLNFDLLNEQKKSPLEEAREKAQLAKLERSVKVRRQLLVSHQVLGFITLGALAATLVIGQLNYQDKYARGNDTGQYYVYHEGLGIGTAGLFAATGIVALAAPNPYPKPIKFDSAFVHKGAMLLATIGMAAQIVLGPIIATREGKLDQRDYAMAHLVTGYATFGFMTAGVLAYVF